MLKPAQKTLEWLIVRFHIHDYNIDELICIALPYHGTRLFARLIQIFDLKNSYDKWQWLYPLQRKGLPLSKVALFNHCASDVSFLKLICEFTVDTVKIYDHNAFKLATLYGFYSTTIVGALQHATNVTELHLTYMLPSLMLGLSSHCIDYTASVFIIIATALTKTSFQERLRRKLMEKITMVNHNSLQISVILLVNILYQAQDLENATLSPRILRNILENSSWFIPSLGKFISSGVYRNIFFLALVRDTLRSMRSEENNQIEFLNFIHNLLDACRLDDLSAEKLIEIIINESKKTNNEWGCELVQKMERQYPNAWDNVVSALLKNNSFESLSRALGLTSVISQIQCFEKLNHPLASIRIEAIKYIAENPESVKIKYIEGSLMARWEDEDPNVVEAMFLLPKNLRYFSAEICQKLVLKCWTKSNNEWNNLLIKIIDSLKVNEDLGSYSTAYTILFLPFLVSSSPETADVRSSILEVNLPLLQSVRRNSKISLKDAINEALKDTTSLPTVDDLLRAYSQLPQANVCTFTLLLLLSASYANCTCLQKLEILSLVFRKIFPKCFNKLKWRPDTMTWSDDLLEIYYARTHRKIPTEIAHRYFVSILEYTPLPQQFSCFGWLDFSEEQANLIASLYMHLNNCSSFCDETGCSLLISFFIQKYFNSLQLQMNFLCNMCLVHKENISLVSYSFGMMKNMLKNSNESYAWMLSLSCDNIIVPCILIFLYSESSELRAAVVRTIEILCMSFGLAISKEITYVELLKHVLQFKDEIVLDREQLPSVLYAFLSQDVDVQAVLSSSTRCFTKNVFETLLDCIINERTPLSVSASLLLTIDFLQDAATVTKLIVLAYRVLTNTDIPSNSGSSIVVSVIDKFNVKEISVFERENVRRFLEYCMENCSKIKIRRENGVTCLGTIILRKISTDLFDKLQADLQKYLLRVVVNICAAGDNTELVSAANSFMKKITLNCELIVSYLERMKSMNFENCISNISDENGNDSKKLKRKPVITLPKANLTAWSQSEWNVGIALLELIQNKKKLDNCWVLLPLLFDVLQKCCEMDDKMPMEYVKQVCLSCILNCSEKLSVDCHDVEKLQRLFSVELVVNCIRMSPNPQTHHHALLLLAHCATVAPNQVLHNIMEIFTFMGSSVLRQDDAFSFQIISNILKTIVPLLIRRKPEDNNVDDSFSLLAIRDVLKVFAVSIPDIPDHRRIPLLLNLMNILNEGEYVHIFAVLALHCAARTLITNKNTTTKYVEVVLELILLLPLPRMFASFQKILEYTNRLPHNIDNSSRNEFSLRDELLDMKELTNKELHHLKYNLLNFISSALSKTELIHRVSIIEQPKLTSLEIYFKGIIEEVLIYVKSVTDYSSTLKNTNVKYWKVMMSQALEILNKTNALLTSDTFLTIIRDLICHSCSTVQRKSIDLLNWRLQQTKDRDNFVVNDLVSLTPSLMKIVSSISKNSTDDSNELKLNQQTALICLKFLAKYYFSVEHANRFKKILLKLCTLFQKHSDINEHVLACLVLCIAELTMSLKVYAIEALPKFLPELLHLLERYKDKKIFRNDVILLSIITALQKIVETLPNFLSPYLESILFEITSITAHFLFVDNERQLNDDDSKHSNISHKLKLIRQKMSEIPSRVLLPAIYSCFARLCEIQNFCPIKPLMDVLAESFQKGGQFSPELTHLFLSVFDFRCTADNVNEEQILLVENYVIDALCKIVLKCSETTFRPFYHKLYDWGVIASKEQSKKDRIITYYRILCDVSEKLKSIFVLFASNFIRNAAEMLVKNNVAHQKQFDNVCVSEEKTVLLIDSILKTLHNVFKYDTVKFLTKDRFNMLVEPLVNQIENIIGDYEKRSAEIIVPTVARFAAATSDDSLWKQFNYLILLKTRHSSPQVRLSALEVVCTFTTYLGDNFLPFLPETVPFLAELLEDENENVEKQTHKAVQRLEQILEEPIQKYF